MMDASRETRRIGQHGVNTQDTISVSILVLLNQFAKFI